MNRFGAFIVVFMGILGAVGAVCVLADILRLVALAALGGIAGIPFPSGLQTWATAAIIFAAGAIPAWLISSRLVTSTGDSKNRSV